MANPQLENGIKEELSIKNGDFTRIHNHIIETLVSIPFKGCELAVCLYILRKTYGFCKEEDSISLSQFQKALKRTRSTIVKALKNLQLVQLVELVQPSIPRKKGVSVWKFNRNPQTWKVVQPVELVHASRPEVVQPCRPLVVQPVRHTKETLKETLKENNIILSEKIKKALDGCQKINGIKHCFLVSLLKQFSEDEIVSELIKADTWVLANPSREKKNYQRFFNNWMNTYKKNQASTKTCRGWSTPSDIGEFQGGVIKI